MTSVREWFDLSGRVALITGGAGLLGVKQAEAIATAGGTPGLVDIAEDAAEQAAARLAKEFDVPAFACAADITRPEEVRAVLETVLERSGRVDILINNAANNPPVESGTGPEWSRLEHFPLDQWHADLAVGLTGAFLCSQIIGGEMARNGRGVILNIASDLALIGPDQRVYRRNDVPEDRQPAKPVTYSVVKTGLIGLTRYLATYWADRGIRVNALSPGGVYNGQPDDFVERLASRIPLGRMADLDEYQGAVVFLCSDASSYMTGANLVMDGGRTAW
jgi:NAD(P)-dependent dehydrogenase (short-subunit alcohol dehydrogenase family)